MTNFYLDSVFRKICELCGVPDNPASLLERVISEVVFITPNGFCYYSDEIFCMKYKLPTISQESLFGDVGASNLEESVSILGREYVNLCSGKSLFTSKEVFITKMKDSTNVFFDFGGGASVQKTQLLDQNYKMPNFDKALEVDFSLVDSVGSEEAIVPFDPKKIKKIINIYTKANAFPLIKRKGNVVHFGGGDLQAVLAGATF